MRKIVALQPLENFLLQLQFENNVKKVFDVKPYLQFPVFSPLKEAAQFNKVVNKGYFIEWPAFEIDLSADTLWHEGVGGAEALNG